MSNIFRCRTNKRLFRNLANFDSIICNKSVSTLDKLYCSFALTNSAITNNQQAFAVNFNENTMSGNSWSKLYIHIRNYRRRNLTCSVSSTQNRNLMFFSSIHKFVIRGYSSCNNNGRRFHCKYSVYYMLSLLRAEFIKISIFSISDKHKTGIIEIIKKACKFKTRTNDIS